MYLRCVQAQTRSRWVQGAVWEGGVGGRLTGPGDGDGDGGWLTAPARGGHNDGRMGAGACSYCDGRCRFPENACNNRQNLAQIPSQHFHPPCASCPVPPPKNRQQFVAGLMGDPWIVYGLEAGELYKVATVPWRRLWRRLWRRRCNNPGGTGAYRRAG